jgi:hypothetical protein
VEEIPEEIAPGVDHGEAEEEDEYLDADQLLQNVNIRTHEEDTGHLPKLVSTKLALKPAIR